MTLSLSKKYAEYENVFSVENADILFSHKVTDHIIDLNEREPLYDSLYNLFNTELEVLRTYLNDALVKGWIQCSVSSAETSVLFVSKKNRELCLYVDYWDLNQIMIKNRHLLPLISETLNWLSEAKIFFKLNLKDTYHHIQIKEGNKWKTAFHICYSHFKYMIMSFRLVNTSVTFQDYINWALTEIVNIFCVVYLNNILIYSETLTEHEKHVKQVLKRLQSFQLYTNLKKCEFSTTKIEFLEFIIFTEDVVMNLQRIEVIKDWSESKTFQKVQVFLDFANFYQCFIHCYSQIAAPLMNLIKGSKNDKNSESFNFSLSMREAFIKLQDTFTCASILVYYDSALHI